MKIAPLLTAGIVAVACLSHEGASSAAARCDRAVVSTTSGGFYGPGSGYGSGWAPRYDYGWGRAGYGFRPGPGFGNGWGGPRYGYGWPGPRFGRGPGFGGGFGGGFGPGLGFGFGRAYRPGGFGPIW